MSDEQQMSPLPEDEEEVPWEQAESTNVHSFRRVGDITQIRFKNKAGELSEYHYSGVSEELHEKMRAADSIGSFVQHNIVKNATVTSMKQPAPVPSS